MWLDLLNVPFERMDCFDLAREFCRRKGVYLPNIGRGMDPSETMDQELEYVGARAEDATRVCDLVIGDPEKYGWPSHVAVVVEVPRDGNPAVALSTSQRSGAYAWPVWRHAREYGVWRSRAS